MYSKLKKRLFKKKNRSCLLEHIRIWEEEKQKQHLTHKQYKQNLEIEEYLCDQHDAIVKYRQKPRVYE